MRYRHCGDRGFRPCVLDECGIDLLMRGDFRAMALAFDKDAFDKE